MTRHMLTVGAVLAAASFLGGGASAQAPSGPPDAKIVAPLQGAAFNFVPRQVVVTQGQGLELYSLDVLPHDVTSNETDGEGFAIFGSDAINYDDTVRNGPAQVNGVKDLAPGAYGFYCTIHPQMGGTLTVVEAP